MRRALLAALLAAGLFQSLSLPRALHAAPPPAAGDTLPQPPAGLCGRLLERDGLPVLELWGEPEQSAYAEGWLLGDRLAALFDDYVLHEDVLPDTQVYEAVLIPSVRRQFVWDEAYVRRLEALMAGVRDRLGAPPRSRVLDRELKLDDLMAVNALADWFGLLCSTLTVWGARSADGLPLTARNLDFPHNESMAKAQIVKIHHASRRRCGYIEVSWPGLVGVYTAMNADGVGVFMHDAPGLPPSHANGFTPRSLILDEALAAAGADTFLDDVARVLRSRRVLIGNNIHVSGPRHAGEQPAAVFEYDSNERGQGVTMRLADAGDSGRGDALWCTNHQRARQPSNNCWRYTAISGEIEKLAASAARLGPAEAIELIRKARQPATLHTVVTQPYEHKMFILIPAISERVVAFDLDDWRGVPITDSGVRGRATGATSAADTAGATGAGAGAGGR